jgi:hypothetical protein
MLYRYLLTLQADTVLPFVQVRGENELKLGKYAVHKKRIFIS